MNVADQQSHLPIEFEANWTVRDISTAPASTCASRASKALHGRLDLWESEGAKWRQKAVAGAHVSFTIRSHEPISFMFLVLTVSLGFHPSPTADKLKAKEQNKLFVRVPALQLLTVVTRIRITYPSSTAFIEQRRVRIYIYVKVYMNSGRTGISLQSHSGPERRLCCVTSLSLHSVAVANVHSFLSSQPKQKL